MSANGTAGIWRRSCIDTAGGWAGDMLTEDLDLGLRAQISGWRVLYLRDVIADAELPVTMGAFRTQQFRWVKGMAQCLRRLGPRVWNSRHPWPARIEALTRLSVCLTFPALVVLVLTLLPLLWMGEIPRIDALPYLGVSAIGVPYAMVLAQHELYRRPHRSKAWWFRAMHMPLMLLIGAGLVANSMRAVVEGLLNRDITFESTPKGAANGVEGRGDGHRREATLSRGLVVELLFMLYSAATFWVALERGQLWALPFLFSCVCGSALVTVLVAREDLAVRVFPSP
jgi:hypothetical protein